MGPAAFCGMPRSVGRELVACVSGRNGILVGRAVWSRRSRGGWHGRAGFGVAARVRWPGGRGFLVCMCLIMRALFGSWVRFVISFSVCAAFSDRVGGPVPGAAARVRWSVAEAFAAWVRFVIFVFGVCAAFRGPWFGRPVPGAAARSWVRFVTFVFRVCAPFGPWFGRRVLGPAARAVGSFRNFRLLGLRALSERGLDGQFLGLRLGRGFVS